MKKLRDRLSKIVKRQKTSMYIYHHHHHHRAGCTDIPDPLSPLLPIVHRPR